MTQEPRWERRGRLTPVGLLADAPTPRTREQAHFDRVVHELEARSVDTPSHN